MKEIQNRELTNLGIIILSFNDLVDTEFNCETNIVFIKYKDDYILIDTFLGESYIKEALEYLNIKKEDIKYVVNTHSDWDHVFGNSFFNEDIIIASKKTKEYLRVNGLKDINEYKKYSKDWNKLKLSIPNITFENNFSINDNIEIIYTPAHTKDCVSILLKKEKVIIVGDNCEEGKPSDINYDNLDETLKTIKYYESLKYEYYIVGHGRYLNIEDIIENRIYIENLINSNSKE